MLNNKYLRETNEMISKIGLQQEETDVAAFVGEVPDIAKEGLDPVPAPVEDSPAEPTMVAPPESFNIPKRAVEDYRPSVFDVMTSRIHHGFTVSGDDLYGMGCMNQEERIALSSAIGKALGHFNEKMKEMAPWAFERKVEIEIAKQVVAK